MARCACWVVSGNVLVSESVVVLAGLLSGNVVVSESVVILGGLSVMCRKAWLPRLLRSSTKHSRLLLLFTISMKCSMTMDL